MKNRTKVSLTSLGLLGVGVGLTLRMGAASWQAETARAVEKMKQNTSSSKTTQVSFIDFGNLPAPVARYFRFALPEGQPIIKTARIQHGGEFQLNGKWIPFESEEHFSANPAAFVWDAKMRLNPLMNIRVRDGYSGGQGSMVGKIFAVYPVVRANGKDERLASGALQRYLAESAWQPTALLPSDHLQWSPIDENRALATLKDAGLTVSLEFTFNEKGEITNTFSPARYYEKNGEYKLFPWVGRFWNYRKYSCMMVPTEGEVAWQLPEGLTPYWRGRLTEAEYEFEK